MSGSWLPISYGIGVCLHPPCTDEPRIKLCVGDMVLVTRWRKYYLCTDCYFFLFKHFFSCFRYWLFGEKIQNIVSNGNEAIFRVKGWFPRKCAVEIVDCEDVTNFKEKKLN